VARPSTFLAGRRRLALGIVDEVGYGGPISAGQNDREKQFSADGLRILPAKDDIERVRAADHSRDELAPPPRDGREQVIGGHEGDSSLFATSVRRH
jgi:hypothetical protein